MKRYLLIAVLLMPAARVWAEDEADPPVTLGEEAASEMGKQNDEFNQRQLDRENEEFKQMQQDEHDRQLEDRIKALEDKQKSDDRWTR